MSYVLIRCFHAFDFNSGVIHAHQMLLSCLPCDFTASVACLQDPIEDKYPDESRQAVLRRNRISSTQSLSRANSRGSGAGQRPRSHVNSPAYDPFLPSGPQARCHPELKSSADSLSWFPNPAHEVRFSKPESVPWHFEMDFLTWGFSFLRWHDP